MDGTAAVTVTLKSEYPTVAKKIIPTTPNTSGGITVDAIVDGTWEGNHQMELDDPIDGEDNIAPYEAEDEKAGIQCRYWRYRYLSAEIKGFRI